MDNNFEELIFKLKGFSLDTNELESLVSLYNRLIRNKNNIDREIYKKINIYLQEINFDPTSTIYKNTNKKFKQNLSKIQKYLSNAFEYYNVNNIEKGRKNFKIAAEYIMNLF
jgi:hypothetical protein